MRGKRLSFVSVGILFEVVKNFSMVLRAAVVGCGRIGCGFDDEPLRKTISTHAGAYHKNEKTELIALCDIDEQKLEKYGKKFSVNNLFTNIDEMIQKVNPEIISICTLPEEHAQMVIKTSNAGVKGIFCEKPIADSLENAKKIIDVCKKNGTVILIDHQRRFDHLNSLIKKLLENNQLGKIFHSTFYYTAGIHNTGTHIIDLMRYFFGDIEWVSGYKSEVSHSNKNDPNIFGILKFRNGPMCYVKPSDVSDYLIFEGDILGSKGRIRLLSSGFEVEYYTVTNSKYFSGYKELEKDDFPYNIPKEKELISNGVNHLIDCVQNGIKPISTASDGLRVLEAILGLIKSSENDSKKIYLT